jgi:hypothetical protein
MCAGVLFLHAATIDAQSAPAVRTWTVSATPTVRIGDGATTSTQFTKVVGVRRMPSGEIVVEDDATRQLRVFSATGAFIKSLSGKGQGPGEFSTYLGVMTRIGDTLVIAEGHFQTVRVHRFTLGGYLTRSVLRVCNTLNGVQVRDQLSNGAFLVAGMPPPGGEGGPAACLGVGGSAAGGRATRFFTNSGIGPGLSWDPVPGVIVRGSLAFGVLPTVDATTITWMGTFPSVTSITVVVPMPRNPVVAAYVPWGAKTIAAASGTRIWIGDSGSGLIRLFDARGAPVGQFTVPIPARPVSSAALDRERRAALDTMTGEPPAVLEAYTRAQFSRTAVPRAPFFSGFVAGIDGEMWVQEFSDDSAAPVRYLVLDASGVAIARVTLPQSRVTARDIGRDYILGVHVDSDDVERVVQYTLNRR